MRRRPKRHLSRSSHPACRSPSTRSRRYTEGGERAVSAFEAGMAGYETRAFRGLGVFVSMPVRRGAAACGASCAL